MARSLEARAAAAARRLKVGEPMSWRDQAQRLADLALVCLHDPADREAALALATGQCRFTRLLLDDEEGDDAAAVAAAVERLRALATAQIGDAAFLARLLESWDEHVYSHPWPRVAAALSALAAYPQDRALQRALIRGWVAASAAPPGFELPDDRTPVGFAESVQGGRTDALAAQHALREIDCALARDGDDADLRLERARLLSDLNLFAAAADDFDRAAALLSTPSLIQAGGPERARDAADEARRHREGRASLSAALAGALGNAMAQLADPNEGLQASFSDLDRLLRGQPDLPDEEAMQELAALARTIATQVATPSMFEPAPWREMGADEVAQGLDPRQHAADAAWQAHGLRPVCWAEHAAYSRRFGAQAVCGVWLHDSGDTVALHSTAGAVEAVDLETEFADGTQLVTTLGRGRNFLGGGPAIDTLHVDAVLPRAHLLALHRARVAHRLAKGSALVRPQRRFADFVAAQERQRMAKLDYRRRVGLDDFEACGIPAPFPEHFVPRVQEAVRAAMAALPAAG